MPQPKLGNIRVIFPNFSNSAYCEKYLKDNKHNNLHLARKYARIFVYLFLKAHGLTRATLSENCSFHGTDYVRRQLSEHIFAANGSYCLFIIHEIF